MQNKAKQKENKSKNTGAESVNNHLDPILELDAFISLTQASKICLYSQEYISLLARRGLIGAVKKGRNWVITRRVLFNYIQKNSIEQKGNHKGNLVPEEKFKFTVSRTWLTSSLKDLANRFWQGVKGFSLTASLRSAGRKFHSALASLKSDWLVFSFGKLLTNIRSLLFWKKFALTSTLVILGLVSFNVLPTAAKYYQKDLATIGKFLEATVVKSFNSAKKSFTDTVVVYQDTADFVKQPNF